MLFSIETRPTLLDRVKKAQDRDEECGAIRKRVLEGEDLKLKVDNDGVLRFEGRVWCQQFRD